MSKFVTATLLWQNKLMFPYIKNIWFILLVTLIVSWFFRNADDGLGNLIYVVSYIASMCLIVFLTYWVPAIWFNGKARTPRMGEKETLKNKTYNFFAGFYWLIYLIVVTLLLSLFLKLF